MTGVWLLAAGAAAFAGFSRGFAAFGTAMIYVPLMTLAFDARTAVVTLFLIDILPAIPLVHRAWADSDRTTLSWMALGAGLLSPVGVAILRIADKRLLECLLGLILLAATSALLSGRKPRFGAGRRAALLAGGTAGLAGGICGIFGPPAMIYFLGRERRGPQTRADAVLFLTGESLLLGLLYLFSGMVRLHDLRVSLLLLPLYAGSCWLGARSFSHAAEASYRRVVLLLLWAMAALLTLRAGWGLLWRY
jgi:uncharacterized protein